MNINSWEKLEQTVLRIGLLPYFRNKIKGFSVEENVPEILLWDLTDGPWDWKGSVIRNLRVAYGKFFGNRAGYISLECLQDFINIRRNESRLAKGSEEERIFNVLVENESLLSRELKSLTGYSAPRKSDSRFETAMTRLQMAGYVTIADFEYNYDRQGNRYGWGMARYTTPEALYELGAADCSVSQSFERLFSRLYRALPDANPVLLSKLIG